MAAPARKRIRMDHSPGGKMVAIYPDRDRDAGFCSAEDDEDLDTDMHSPTDVSEDSVDVKVKPITSLIGGAKNKRKCVEPKKFGDEVKRRAVQISNGVENESNPFRPWSLQTPTGFVPKGYQEEPLSLVLRDSGPVVRRPDITDSRNSLAPAAPRPRPQDVVRLRDPVVRSMMVKPPDVHVEDTSERLRTFSVESLISERPGTSMSVGSASVAGDLRRPSTGVHQSQQRNYKNMTRERRIEANARERTRVHTISAAFDTLRRAVPAYSHNQKLSKLSVLRIACSYILTLSRVAGDDYSADGSQPSLADCVDNVSRTIQLEGKLRKKKDE